MVLPWAAVRFKRTFMIRAKPIAAIADSPYRRYSARNPRGKLRPRMFHSTVKFMAHAQSKDVLTTGQVAKICRVAPRTVSKWFDSGRLRGYRIPGSKDRRIPVAQLLRFMQVHDIPTVGLELGTVGVLIVDDDFELAGILREALSRDGRFEVSVAASAFEAGVLSERMQPRVMVVDVAVDDVNPLHFSQALRAHENLSGTKLIAVGASLTEGQGAGLMQGGFAGYLRKPFDVRQLQDLIEAVTQ